MVPISYQHVFSPTLVHTKYQVQKDMKYSHEQDIYGIDFKFRKSWNHWHETKNSEWEQENTEQSLQQKISHRLFQKMYNIMEWFKISQHINVIVVYMWSWNML